MQVAQQGAPDAVKHRKDENRRENLHSSTITHKHTSKWNIQQ
jgi:hypothetical protein